MDALTELKIESSADVKTDADWQVWAWCPVGLEEERRRKIIAALTPLVGKMNLSGESWVGEGNGICVRAYQAQACKILGYKTVTKTVRKEIKRDPEYEEVEEEVSVPITDCDVKSGRFTESDIEVPA